MSNPNKFQIPVTLKGGARPSNPIAPDPIQDLQTLPVFKLLNAKCKSLNCCKSKELHTMILSSLQLQEFLPPGSQSCVFWLCLFCEPAWGSKRMHLQSEMHLQGHSECITHPFFNFKIILLRLQDSCKGPTISCPNAYGLWPLFRGKNQ